MIASNFTFIVTEPCPNHVQIVSDFLEKQLIKANFDKKDFFQKKTDQGLKKRTRNGHDLDTVWT